MDTIRTQGRYLHKALPVHASVGNMVRRVLKIVREEYAAGRKVGFREHMSLFFTFGCHFLCFILSSCFFLPM